MYGWNNRGWEVSERKLEKVSKRGGEVCADEQDEKEAVVWLRTGKAKRCAMISERVESALDDRRESVSDKEKG